MAVDFQSGLSSLSYLQDQSAPLRAIQSQVLNPVIRPPVPCAITWHETCLLMPSRPFAEQRPSSGLSLNLASNNPFRRHAESPLSTPGETSLRSPFSDPYARPNTGHVHNRPVSRNPFLDSTDAYAKQPPASLSRPLSRPPPNSTMFPATGGSGPDQTAVNNVAGPLV